MKIALKPVLWTKDTDKNGFTPIAIRITGGNKVAYYNTGIKVPEGGWDGSQFTKKMVNHDIQNARLKKKLSDMEREIVNREMNGQATDAQVVKALFKGETSEARVRFMKFAQRVVDSKVGGTKLRYNVELSKLQKYAGEGLSFGEITPKWLTGYYKYLTSPKKGKKDKVIPGNHHNTAINAFKVIRHVFNEAIEEKVISKHLYPFDGWTYPVYQRPTKEFLTLQECDRLWELLNTPLPKEMQTVTAFFLLEVFSGIRVSDWGKYRIEQVAKHREMVFTTTKTGTDVRLPLDLMPSLSRVVDYIEDNGLKFNMTPEHANRFLKSIGPMAKITKTLTTHVARHTFATLSLAIGTSRAAIALAMGITERQVETYAKTSPDILRMSLQRIGGGL